MQIIEKNTETKSETPYKIVLTAFSLVTCGIIFAVIQRSLGLLTKYAALSQFDNTETSNQTYQLLSVMSSSPYLLGSLLTLLLLRIWK